MSGQMIDKISLRELYKIEQSVKRRYLIKE